MWKIQWWHGMDLISKPACNSDSYEERGHQSQQTLPVNCAFTKGQAGGYCCTHSSSVKEIITGNVGSSTLVSVNEWCTGMGSSPPFSQKKQGCIPVGCVWPACWLYRGRGCLPIEGVRLLRGSPPSEGVHAYRRVCLPMALWEGRLPPHPTVDRMNDTHTWKHYLPAISFAGGKNNCTRRGVREARSMILFCVRGKCVMASWVCLDFSSASKYIG